MTRRSGHQDKIVKWYNMEWRPMMAMLYMGLIFLNYGARPIINYFQQKEFNLAETVSIIKDLSPPVQVQVIELMKDKQAIPDTLPEFVHIAFGAILTVSAAAAVRKSNDSSSTPPAGQTTNQPTSTLPSILKPLEPLVGPVQQIDNPDKH